MLKELPVLEEKIESGALHLSSIATVQSFLRNEKKNQKIYTSAQKLELLESVSGKSLPEAQRVLTAISPLAIQKESERVLTPEKTEISFVASKDLLDKFERLKNYMSHKNAHWSYAELFEEIADIAIKKLKLIEDEKVRKPQGSFDTKQSLDLIAKDGLIPFNSNKTVIHKAMREQNPSSSIISPRRGNEEVQRETRHVADSKRRHVWSEFEGRCSYVCLLTGRRYESRKFLQLEHCLPWGKGGGHELENLRLLCATHNRLMAVQVYGEKKLAPAGG